MALAVADQGATNTIQPWYDLTREFDEIAEQLKKRKMHVGLYKQGRNLTWSKASGRGISFSIT